MRIRRTQEGAIRLMVLRRVLDEAAKTLHQRGVFDARLETMVVLGLVHAAAFRIAVRYSGTTAVASISSRAFFSTSPATCTTAIAG